MRRHGLQRFILISLLLHGLVLALWRTSGGDARQSAAPLSVAFIQDEMDVAKSSNPDHTTPTSPPEVLAVQSPAADIAQADAPVDEVPANPPVRHEINPAQHTATVSAETVITPADDSLLPFEQISQGDNSASIRQLRLDVYLALRHYFSYPPLARKRGWEGEVVVSIRINHDGYLQDIHLIRGSGYALLDRSALEALSRVDRIPNQLSQTIDMELPILYQLQEG